MGKSSTFGEPLKTKDKDFKPGVDVQISQMLVKHLEHTQMFRKVILRDVKNNLAEDYSQMDALVNEGIDIAVVGDLGHFSGTQSGAAGVAGMFGLVGMMTEAITNPKTVGGHVEYDNVKIIDLKNKFVLWEGDIEHTFEDRVTFYDGPVAYALRTLKEANNKFTEKLKYVLER